MASDKPGDAPLPSPRPDIRAVICDLDGTLLSTDAMVPPVTKQALVMLRNRGVAFGIASGRDIVSIGELTELWGITDVVDLVVGMNGAEFSDRRDGTITHTGLVEPDAFRHVIDHFAGMPVNFTIIEDGAYIAPFDDELLALLAYWGRVRVGVDDDFQRILASPQAKLHVMCLPENMAAVQEHAASLDDPRVVGVRTGPTLFEYMAPGITKSTGLDAVASAMDCGVEALMAFGDAENDIELVRDAGVGVAMGNACADVMHVCDYRTASNADDGVAVFLQRWFGEESS